LNVSRIRLYAYLFAVVLAASLAYALFQIPVQVSDSAGFILQAQETPSTAEAFRRGLSVQTGYFRPMRFAQIKAIFDLSQGHYTFAYRGVHVLLLFATVLLFVRSLQVATITDLAAAAFALTVLTGMHTFLGTLREAYPINHFLEMIALTLAALNLAQGSPRWAKDVAAGVLFVFAALVLESGVLVWVVALSARASGLRGLSTRGVIVMTVLFGGYLIVRFFLLAKGLPGLDARPSGFLLERLEPSELQARFGDGRALFYAYNVASSALSVLIAEPRAGVWVAVRDVLRGDIPPRTIVNVISSCMTTGLIAMAAMRRWRRHRSSDDADALFVVFAAVLAANAVFSFAYTKDEIVSVAGAFYALASYAAVRALLESNKAGGRAVTGLVAVAMLLISSTWVIRVSAQHYLLREAAFVTRNDWAALPASLSQTDPDRRAILDRLRLDALERGVAAPHFLPRWQQRWFGE
jgi:hypothetical protein